MSIYIKALQKYWVTSGRTRRKEFWTFNLVNFTFFILLFVLTFLIHNELMYKISCCFASVIFVLLLPPTLSITLRRLHDTGRDAWYFLINLLPIIGNIIFIVSLFEDSSPSYNEYGEYPKFTPNF
ncbi:MAG TPA: DUF805 domain-containing protein [Prolixibacteraceae bacterium]|nr:DUF805 domain-containing protein [Prolixibacteraceae bacterium]